MNTIADAIKNNETALAAATQVVEGVLSPDWVACRDALRAISVTTTPRACYSVETADALDAVGNRRRNIMSAMQSDPDGQFILTKLAGEGVVWAHPRTIKLIDGLMAAEVATPDDKQALVSLSAPTTYPHAGVTADQCRDAFLAAGVSDWFAAQSAVIRERLTESTITTRQGLVDLLVGAV